MKGADIQQLISLQQDIESRHIPKLLMLQCSGNKENLGLESTVAFYCFAAIADESKLF